MKSAQEKSQPLKLVGTGHDHGDRFTSGWRAGKPIEDPEKMKRWGFVTARPSEYLICIKNGKINRGASGRGARVFKWPWEAVAIVPTTLQQIEFTADQITRERVGVTVTGIAVFRIAEPELAFQVLNFTYGERACEKLAGTLGEMFVGAARRLIANLTLDECLMKRKESIAAFLMQEIAPIVSGKGDPEDATDRGWGVVIDTIEIQNVHIQSRQVFEDLQAPFRAELTMKVQMAELERQREVAERRAETDRRSAEASIQSERETRILKARAEAEAAEAESSEALRADQARARATAAELERKEALARKRLEVDEGISLRQAESGAAIDRNRRALEWEKELAAFQAAEERRRILTQAGLAELKAAEEKRRAIAEAELAGLEAEAGLAEESHRAAVRRLEQDRERRGFEQETELALKQKQQGIDLEARRQDAELKRLEAAVETERQRAMAEVEQLVNQGRALRDMVTTGLPQIAAAFQQNFGSIHYTHLGGGEEANPLGMVAAAFGQVLTVARSFGFDPARLAQAGSGTAGVVSAGQAPGETPRESSTPTGTPDAT
jgi:regulator of protease activity HflC (stomatin/prohibitin superfamily)